MSDYKAKSEKTDEAERLLTPAFKKAPASVWFSRAQHADLLEIAMQLSWNTKFFGDGVHPPASEIAEALERIMRPIIGERAALIEGAELALSHLRLCDCREESAAGYGSQAIELLEKGLGLSHTKSAHLALSRMRTQM